MTRSTGGNGASGGATEARTRRVGRIASGRGATEGEKRRSGTGSVEVSMKGGSGRGTVEGTGVAEPADPPSAPSREVREGKGVRGGGFPPGRRGEGARDPSTLRLSPEAGEWRRVRLGWDVWTRSTRAKPRDRAAVRKASSSRSEKARSRAYKKAYTVLAQGGWATSA